MSTSAVNGWDIPDDTDAPNIEAIYTLAQQIDKVCLPAFASASRDVYVTAPEDAQLAYITDRFTVEKYDEEVLLWKDADYYRTNNDESVQIPSTDTTLVDIPGMSFSVVEGFNYAFHGFITFSAHEDNDIVLVWDSPGANRRRWTVPTTASPSNVTTVMSTPITINLSGSASERIYFFQGYMIDVDSTGTAQLQFSKSSDTDSTDTIVYGVAGTFLSVARIS